MQILYNGLPEILRCLLLYLSTSTFGSWWSRQLIMAAHHCYWWLNKVMMVWYLTRDSHKVYDCTLLCYVTFQNWKLLLWRFSLQASIHMCASCFFLLCDLQSCVLLWSFSLWSHRYACILLAKYAYDCHVIHNCSLVFGLVFFSPLLQCWVSSVFMLADLSLLCCQIWNHILETYFSLVESPLNLKTLNPKP